MKMTYQAAHTEAKEFHSNWLYKVSGVSALIAGGLLVAAAMELILAVVQTGATNDWLLPLQNNWLIVIFKLHADFSNTQFSLLDRLNLLDIVILALIATMLVGLYMALRRTSRLWSLIALAQPIIGMMIFVATKMAGRSSVMGAEVVISMVMLRSNLFTRRTAYIGIVSGLLLLVGDIGVSTAPSNVLAIVMGVGYVLLISWLFLVGFKLLRFGQANNGGK
jgi:hypothetical protein